MIKKGTIAVRIKGGFSGKVNGKTIPFKKEIGTIFKTIKDSKYFFKYNSVAAASPEDVRLATPKEIKAYNQGIRHIDDINPIVDYKNLIEGEYYYTSLTDGRNSHLFKIKRNLNPGSFSFAIITEGCIFENEIFNKRNRFFTDIYINKLRYATPEEIKHLDACIKANEYVKQSNKQTKIKKNEKSRIIKQESRSVSRGSCITSSSTRQIATASRLVGNSKTAKYQRTRISNFKISSNIISI